MWQESTLLLALVFGLAVLMRTFLLQAFYIPSGSMEPTLLVGDQVLVNKVIYELRDPERGEVIVFKGPENWVPENRVDPDRGLFAEIGRTLGDLVGISQPGEKDFIKRVIALPGDRISCCDPLGRIYVNGAPVDEPYVVTDAPREIPEDPSSCKPRRFKDIVVEPGMLFVMGDHRQVSLDSRCQGTVPVENVIGKAMVVALPFSRWASLADQEAFAQVPQPQGRAAGGPASPAVPPSQVLLTWALLATAIRRRLGCCPQWVAEGSSQVRRVGCPA